MSARYGSEQVMGGGPAPAGFTDGLNAIRALRELASLVRDGTNGKALRDKIVEQAKVLFDADAVALWRIESREQVWRIAAATGLSGDFSSVSIPISESEAASASVTSGPLLVGDAGTWSLVEGRRALYERESIVSFLVIPLYIRGTMG